MAASAPRAVVIGGGVVGAAVAMQLARRGAEVTLLERLPALALQASGTSSGVLHTGFDSTPGDLVEPSTTEAERNAGMARWRAFVEAAATLPA
jgi:L-2-hydroxyglutarate oxidase LhgO